jgi:branched-chain amino acid aminotransferase
MSTTQTQPAATPAGVDPSLNIWLNGEIVPAAQAMVSVFDHGLLYGDGVFEGIRIYGGRIFKLKTHLRRLYDSAKAIRLDIPQSLDELEAACREARQANGIVDGYIRLCVTRGIGTLSINPFLCKAPCVFIIADDITLYPDELYRDGMGIITSSVTRNHPGAVSPRIKSLNYLNNILAKIQALDAGVLEAVMFNHVGNVAECTGDNIFIVRDLGVGPALISPPLHAGYLEGVTMRVICDLAHEAGIRVHHFDLTHHDLYTADEIFLTGTAAQVIPVTAVDKRTIGDGTPGAMTRQLMGAFHDLVTRDVPED